MSNVEPYASPLEPLIQVYVEALRKAGWEEEAADVLIDFRAGESVVALGAAVCYADAAHLELSRHVLECTLESLDEDDELGRLACLALLGQKD